MLTYSTLTEYYMCSFAIHPSFYTNTGISEDWTSAFQTVADQLHSHRWKMPLYGTNHHKQASEYRVFYENCTMLPVKLCIIHSSSSILAQIIAYLPRMQLPPLSEKRCIHLATSQIYIRRSISQRLSMIFSKFPFWIPTPLGIAHWKHSNNPGKLRAVAVFSNYQGNLAQVTQLEVRSFLQIIRRCAEIVDILHQYDYYCDATPQNFLYQPHQYQSIVTFSDRKPLDSKAASIHQLGLTLLSIAAKFAGPTCIPHNHLIDIYNYLAQPKWENILPPMFDRIDNVLESNISLSERSVIISQFFLCASINQVYEGIKNRIPRKEAKQIMRVISEMTHWNPELRPSAFQIKETLFYQIKNPA